MTSLPLPLRGNNRGRPARNGKKESIGQVNFLYYIYANDCKRYSTDTKTGFQRDKNSQRTKKEQETVRKGANMLT